MEAKITAELGIKSELIRGDHGIFDVAVDGELVFSKDATGRFPLEDEIIDLLRARD